MEPYIDACSWLAKLWASIHRQQSGRIQYGNAPIAHFFGLTSGGSQCTAGWWLLQYTVYSCQALCVAEITSQWIPLHQEEAASLEKCLNVRGSYQKLQKEQIWAAYHQFYISDMYSTEWNTSLQPRVSEVSPTFVQSVSHFTCKI